MIYRSESWEFCVNLPVGQTVSLGVVVVAGTQVAVHDLRCDDGDFLSFRGKFGSQQLLVPQSSLLLFFTQLLLLTLLLIHR